MKRLLVYCVTCVLMLLPVCLRAETAVSGYRIADTMDHSRFVIDLSSHADYSVIRLEHPDRVVLDIHGGSWKVTPGDSVQGSVLVKKLRHAQKDPHTLRIVLDLERPVTLEKPFEIPPRDGKSYRIVVDMIPQGTATAITSSPVVVPAPVASVSSVPRAPVVVSSPMPAPVPAPATHTQMVVTEVAPPPAAAPVVTPPIVMSAATASVVNARGNPAAAPVVKPVPAAPVASPETPIPDLVVPPSKETDNDLIVPPQLIEKPVPVHQAPLPPLPSAASVSAPVPAPVHVHAASPMVATAMPSAPSIMRKPLIIIDPGHGGDDPGTIGRSFHTYEKMVTLAYAELLKKKLEKTGRYRAELTRNDDTFIRLQDRVKIAQDLQANLFISLHADSHPLDTMHGLSIYTLSETASDKESEALAAKENKADIIKGVDLRGASSEVASILINLKQRETKNNSAEFAEIASSELSRVIYVLPKAHRFAGFKVLKGVDVAAVLIELGYLSNRQEEATLVSHAYQQKVTSSLVKAIDHYFSRQKQQAVN